ncbi:hypothetical protein [Ureibacillus sp. FSL W8-0352]|uniref:hypothetical protein n=1 Tax=Ureibacillus sp. FSL W8-0352 TaxID=2954596 RepID=UPI0030F66ED0
MPFEKIPASASGILVNLCSILVNLTKILAILGKIFAIRKFSCFCEWDISQSPFDISQLRLDISHSRKDICHSKNFLLLRLRYKSISNRYWPTSP